MIKPNLTIMAKYNAVMNQKICTAISALPDEVLWQNKNAFFGSILGTLNHLMVGDLIWHHRFNQHPSYPKGFEALKPLERYPLPNKLTQTLYKDKQHFIVHRQALDQMIIGFIDELNESDCLRVLSYNNTKGDAFAKPFSMLLQHLFNHQTHHRGQVTALLTQIGIDVGETDLLMLVADVNR